MRSSMEVSNSMSTWMFRAVWIFSFCAAYLTTLASSDFGPQYVGCYRDGGHDARSMGSMSYDRDSMTLDMCAATCMSLEKTFFGVQSAIECFCDDQYSKLGTSDNCAMSCIGNSRQTCGGGWALGVYRVCPTGHYGPNCNNVCSYCRNNVDNPTFDARCYWNGTCWDGYTPPGFKAAETTNCRRVIELLVATGVLAGVFLLLLGVAILCLCRMRLRLRQQQQEKPQQLQLLQLRPQQPLPTQSNGSVQYRSASSYYEELNDPTCGNSKSTSKSKSRPAAAESEPAYTPTDDYLHPCPTAEYVDNCRANSAGVAAAAAAVVVDASVAEGIYNPSDKYTHLYNPSEEYRGLSTGYAGENIDNNGCMPGHASALRK